MSYDLFAEIAAVDEDKIEAIRNGHYETLSINNIHTRLKLLSGALPYKKEGVKAAHKKIVHECKNYNTLINYELERMETLKIKVPQIDINIYPHFSFYLQFKFTLAKPYLSKDDDQFYICENPIRKDKVFKVPMVSASTWKGNLRWTASQLNPGQADIIVRFFGNEKGKEIEFRRGRLNFFPTFFDRIGLEVINPHDRTTKAGTNPIYIESVPIGATGTFTLLYVPFDIIGRQEAEIKKQVTEDMDIVSDLLSKMMLTYGFSAKKGSGFGVVDRNISGTFEMSGRPVYKKEADSKSKNSNPFSKLMELVPSEKVKETDFSGFGGLKKLMARVKEVMERGHDI